jgi:flagellin-like protein
MYRRYNWKHTQVSPARKAISPLIATLILIAITISGGVLLYRIFLVTAGTVSSNLHFTVTDASASAAGGFSVSGKNDGTFAINAVNAVVTGSDGNPAPGITCTIPTGTSVPPGGSFVCTSTAGGSAVITAGITYSITLTATAAPPNGGEYATSVSVIATS